MDMLRQRTDGIGLGRGDPDLPTPDHIVAAGQDALARGLTRYTPLPGPTSSAGTTGSRQTRTPRS